MRIMFFVVFCIILSGCSTLDIKPTDYQAKWEEAAYREKQPDDLMQMSQRVEKGAVIQAEMVSRR